MTARDEMHLFYEICDVTFEPVDFVEDIKIIRTPEGWRFECPRPYMRYSVAFATVDAAIAGAQRFCAMRQQSRQFE